MLLTYFGELWFDALSSKVLLPTVLRKIFTGSFTYLRFAGNNINPLKFFFQKVHLRYIRVQTIVSILL